jgi:parallel beta-helix repeat protein
MHNLIPSDLRQAVILLAGVLVACGDSSPKAPVASFEEELQTRLITAAPGDVIEIPAGVHAITRSLSLNVDGVTIRGAGMDESILSFKNQQQGAEGLLVSADDFIIEDLAIEDTVGDALKINESNNVTVRRVRTEWTGGPLTSNGAYGIYPVQSTNVLIDGSVAIGASDAGIYVGQSSQIIVRNSRAEYNVAGIEIENSTYADVYDNVATNNTGGILVFDLPGLPVQGGQATRVFANEIFGNNTENFAPAGNIVANVPPGTGLLILANDNIEVFENTFRDNNNVNIMIYSYVLGGRTYDDPNYDPYPERIYIHDNSFSGGGTVPRHPALIALHELTGQPTPNIAWGGLLKPGVENRDLICLENNGEESFVNLNGGIGQTPDYDLAAHRCRLPRLNKIEFPIPGE